MEKATKPRTISNATIYIEGKKQNVILELDSFGDPVRFSLKKPLVIAGEQQPAKAKITWNSSFQTIEQYNMRSRKPVIVNGIAFASEIIMHAQSDNALHRGKLASDTELHGIVFRGGKTIVFHKNGKVKTGFVAADTQIEGKTVPAKNRLGLDTQGRLAEPFMVPEAEGLSRDAVLFRPGTLKTVSGKDTDGSDAKFFESGMLADEADITCSTGKSGEGWRLAFAPETWLVAYPIPGRKKNYPGIKQGTLAADGYVHGKRYSAGKILTFGEKCKVAKVE